MSGFKEWAKKNRLTAKKIGGDIGVSGTMVYRHYKGERVSDRMISKYHKYGVPQSIINKMKKQGV